MADKLPPLPKGATLDVPPLPAGATFEPDRKRATISGQMRRMREPGFVPPQMPEPLSAEELQQQYFEAGKGALIGAPSGVIGIPGDIESLGRMIIPGAKKESFFPTSEEVGTKIFGQPETEIEKSGRTLGTIIGSSLLPKILRTGVKTFLGTPTKTSAEYAKQAEELGFKLSPAQVKADVPVPAKGASGWAEQNQKLANELASKGTGKQVSEINPDFVRERLSTLGNKFNNLYQGKIFNIDLQAVQALDALRNVEQMLPTAAQVSSIKSTANTIVDNFSRLASRPGSKPNTFAIEGDALQKIRNDLSAAARSTSNRGDAHRIYELIDIIDDSIARNHPQIASELSIIRPQYRNTIILEDLTRKGGVKQGNISLEQLGDMLGAQKGGVRRSGDIDQLGELGRELGIRARWQTAPISSPMASEIGKVLGTTLGGAATGIGLRSRYARGLQRAYEKEPSTATLVAEKITGAPAVGTNVLSTNNKD